jgi:hypothetical protein
MNENVLTYNNYIDEASNGKSPFFSVEGGLENLDQEWNGGHSTVLQFKAGEVVDKDYETEDVTVAEAFAKATPYPFGGLLPAYDSNDEVTLEIKVVRIERPWLNLSIVKDGFPRLATHLILAKKTKIYRKTSTSSGNTEASSTAPRVLGLICEPYKTK